MNTCKVNNENFKLKITVQGLKNLLLDEGVEKVISLVSSFYEEKYKEFQSLSSLEIKMKNNGNLNKLLQLRVLNNAIIKDTEHLNISTAAEIKNWITLLHEIGLSNGSLKEVFVCASLSLERDADIDSEQLKNVCYSLKLISTCFLCQNGQFIGDGDYRNNEFVNCLADIPGITEVYKKCTSYEVKDTDNE